MNESLQERLARARAERIAAEQAATKPDMSEYADLVPEAEYERSDEDKKLDTVIGSIDIVTAYRKWINKSPIRDNERRREGIKVSCPVPGHRDANPSAWLNTDKGVWFCAACDQGGDAYDLAAFYHGMTDYKSGQNFHELRRAMAMDFGYTFVSVPGSTVPVMVTPEGGPDDDPVAAPPPLSVVPPVVTPVETNSEPDETPAPAEVVDLYSELMDVEPEIPWRDFIPGGTFLHKYLTLTSRDDVAEEFHFWNAMTVLGFALGRDTTAYDRVPVYGNLFVCTIGDTGSGKSQAKHHMSSLLDMAFRWDAMDPVPTGVKIIRGSASAEALIKSFDHQIMDPSRPKTSLGSVPVKGLIDYAELSNLTGKSDRQGNVLKPVMLEFYDCSPTIGTTSLASGVLLARDAFASAHTTTQPQSLSKLLNQSDSDSGFLNRWFFASGKPKTRVAIGGEIIDIGPAVLPIQAIKTYYDTGSKMLPWSPEAHTKFTQFYYDVIEPTKRDDASGLLARLDLFYKKLSLLFSANIMADRIEETAVDQMIALHPYVLGCYNVPARKLRETTFTQVEDEITRIIQRYEATDKALTAGNLVKELKRKGHRLDLISRVIKVMMDTGIIQAEHTNLGKRGRPSVRYSLVK